MQLGPVTELDRRNKTTSKNFDNDAISAYCDVIVILPLYGQFGAIRKPDFGRIVYRKPDFGRIVCKTHIFINSNLFSYKTENRTKKF